MAAILTTEPLPLTRYLPEAPRELEDLVGKAMLKDRDERHQTVKDLLVDLKDLKQELEFAARQGRPFMPPPAFGVAVPGTDSNSAPPTTESSSVHPTTSAEYVVSEIKRHKLAVLITLAALILVLVAITHLPTGSDAVDSVAVLPFIVAGADPNAEDLSESITQSILENLSQVPNLKVKSHSSVLRLKGPEADPETAGRELGVKSVLTGQVARRGEVLSISVELIDVLHGSNILWSEHFTPKLSEIFQVQEEISREISEKLELRLSGADKKRLEAYYLYLKGRDYWNKRTREDMQQALKFFRQATNVDPHNALAYAGLADCYNMLVIYSLLPPKEAFPEAKAAAEKAIVIDETLAEAHTALAYARWKYDWDWAGAEKDFKRAIDLKASYAPAHQFYANYLASLGRSEEAIEEAKLTQKLDSISLIINADLAWNYYLARRYDEAIEQCRNTLELDPNFFAVHRYLGLAYEQKAMYAEAITELTKAATLSGGSAQLKAALGHAYATSGVKSRAREILGELEETAKVRYVSPYDIATVYAALGEKDQAFNWLHKAYDERSSWLAYLKVNPVFDNLRSDPRFIELLRRVGL
jgi:TolB-like protein/Tfp pilus assembly protein PilF